MADASAAADPFRALGDPNRREIISELAGRELSVRELAEALPISRPAVSRHLRLLKDAGLVDARVDGTRRLYSLDPDGVDDVRAYLERMWGEATARFRLVAGNTDNTGNTGNTDPPVVDDG